MSEPETLRDRSRKNTQSLPLTFPKDGSINNHQTMISLMSYVRMSPRELPTKVKTLDIFLPLPLSGIEDNIALKYTEVPLGAIGGLLAPAKGVGGEAAKLAGLGMAVGQFAATSALGALGDVGAEYLNKAASRAGPGGKSMAKRIIQTGKTLSGQTQEATAQAIGLADNPNLSLSFEGVELRTHNFTWRLVAKSLEESLAIENIINTLKLNALPKKLLGAGFHLSYPSIALINFFPANLIKISDLGCFITSVNVRYDGDGHPVFFTQDKPVIVDLTVSFKERAILTADDYEPTKSIGIA